MSATDPSPSDADSPSLHVVATAGHVDHGKSALVLRLTGIDPDRLAEEKRRGLTIDLGFAWTTLPSGREIGFVDVPGHERFVRNMLAGVGPVRLVLFVVAADEGWKQQSEEHLQIVDVLGCDGAVIAVTKMDLLDRETLDRRTNEIKKRVDGTRLSDASIVCCSASTGEGIERLRTALDEMVGAAPAPDRTARPRQFIDRVFTIKGAGTVVTGTLTGGPIAVGQEAEIVPSGHRARIRGLQTHKRPLTTAVPVSRVAVNLAGTPKSELERGDVLTLPGRWRATSMFEGTIRTVRGLDHPVTTRGAFKFYAGSAERDARIRLFGRSELRPGDQSYARVTLSRPVVLDFKDSFVLREAGRQETVAGGEVLDTQPPARSGRDPLARLDARRDADRAALAWRIVADRGAIRASELKVLAGIGAEHAERHGALRVDSWLVSPQLLGRVTTTLIQVLEAFHAEHPLRPGMDVGECRLLLIDAGTGVSDPTLTDAVLGHLARTGAIVRDGSVLRLARHRLSTKGREDADRLVGEVERAEPTPPSVRELMAAGFERELIQAACTEGRLVRVSSDVVVTPGFLAKAEAVVRKRAGGMTVSSFREALGTTRKYALPILEYFDQRGVTRREGDVRVLKE
ncbi:MAG TPA: selenocysteine-specific translation elongation factor [Actinomycetota bacterium]|nr:selenocysteine-specific translation elongation factor [Actinomycetota bacterium]